MSSTFAKTCIWSARWGLDPGSLTLERVRSPLCHTTCLLPHGTEGRGRERADQASDSGSAPAPRHAVWASDPDEGALLIHYRDSLFRLVWLHNCLTRSTLQDGPTAPPPTPPKRLRSGGVPCSVPTADGSAGTRTPAPPTATPCRSVTRCGDPPRSATEAPRPRRARPPRGTPTPAAPRSWRSRALGGKHASSLTEGSGFVTRCQRAPRPPTTLP